MADAEADVDSTAKQTEGTEVAESGGGGDDQAAAVGEKTTGELANQLMQNPQVLAAIQDRLGGIVGASSGYIESLPASVKRRLKALKKLQSETIKIEAKFYEEVHQMECRYAEQYSKFFEKRRDIITGTIEPTDSDCDWPSDDEKDEDDEGEVKAKVTLTNENSTDATATQDDEVTGIPNFWLTSFKNVDILSDMIQEHDEPIMLHLRDIRVVFSEMESIGFTIEFHFDDNDYFTNSVLTKKYTLRPEPDPSDVLAYEGPEIIRCEGCKIDWKAGKDVTTKTIRKKQKHKGRGTTRTINKTVQVDSFFNFFNPPKVPEGGDADVDDETEALLAADFEIGHLIRERIVPRAVLYFTGDALDDDDFDEEGDEEEGGDEEDDENDPDFDPEKSSQNAEQCKQQ